MAPNGYGKPDESGIRASLQRSVSLGFNQASALGSIKDVTFYANQVNILNNMHKKPDVSVEDKIMEEINNSLQNVVGWRADEQSAYIHELGHSRKYMPNYGKRWIIKLNTNFADYNAAKRNIRLFFPNLAYQSTKVLCYIKGIMCSVEMENGVVAEPTTDDHGKYFLHTPDRFLEKSVISDSNPKRGFLLV